MKVLFLYVSTNMCRDGDLWFYDEGLASAVSCLRQRGHEFALRLVGGRDNLDDVMPWIEAERTERSMIVFLTSIHFSAYAHDIPDTFAQVQGIKQRSGLPTCFAGLWATLNAEELLDHHDIDMVARGELDFALADLCDVLDRGEAPTDVANVWSRIDGETYKPPLRELLPRLDDLPLPARDILPVDRHANERDGILTVLGSRGCPMACEFCTHVVVRKAYDVKPSTYMRVKSVDYLFDEIRAALAAMPNIWIIYFHDDMFLLSKEWRDEFFARYKTEIGLPFGCNMIVEQITPELTEKLAEAGCSHVMVGIESGSVRMRTEVFSKPIGDDRIHAALAHCEQHGIHVKFYALLGAPEETRQDLVESFKGFSRYLADMVQVQVWMAHTTSDLLALDRRAAAVARKQYDPKGDRDAWRLKFYFHYFHRYVAAYHLLQKERGLRARIARAALTLSVRLPFAPELLMARDWDGRKRWPRHLRWLKPLALRALGGLGERLQRDIGPLEQRLAADYMKPVDKDLSVDGWRGVSRIDRRLEEARAMLT